MTAHWRDDAIHDLALDPTSWASARNEFALCTKNSLRAGRLPRRNTLEVPRCRGEETPSSTGRRLRRRSEACEF